MTTTPLSPPAPSVPVAPAMRVWWCPNPPRAVFLRPVKSVEEATQILTLLAEYDLYLGDNLVSVNAGGLEVLADDGEWEDWNDDEGRDIDEVMRATSLSRAAGGGR